MAGKRPSITGGRESAIDPNKQRAGKKGNDARKRRRLDAEGNTSAVSGELTPAPSEDQRTAASPDDQLMPAAPEDDLPPTTAATAGDTTRATDESRVMPAAPESSLPPTSPAPEGDTTMTEQEGQATPAAESTRATNPAAKATKKKIKKESEESTLLIDFSNMSEPTVKTNAVYKMPNGLTYRIVFRPTSEDQHDVLWMEIKSQSKNYEAKIGLEAYESPFSADELATIKMEGVKSLMPIIVQHGSDLRLRAIKAADQKINPANLKRVLREVAEAARSWGDLLHKIGTEDTVEQRKDTLVCELLKYSPKNYSKTEWNNLTDGWSTLNQLVVEHFRIELSTFSLALHRVVGETVDRERRITILAIYIKQCIEENASTAMPLPAIEYLRKEDHLCLCEPCAPENASKFRAKMYKEASEQAEEKVRDRVRAEETESIQKEYHIVMEADMRAKLTAELREQFLPQLREELLPQLREELLPQIRQEIREEVKEDVRQEIREEVRVEVRAEVRQDVCREVRQEAREEFILAARLKKQAEQRHTAKQIQLAEDFLTLKGYEAYGCGYLDRSPGPIIWPVGPVLKFPRLTPNLACPVRNLRPKTNFSIPPCYHPPMKRDIDIRFADPARRRIWGLDGSGSLRAADDAMIYFDGSNYPQPTVAGAAREMQIHAQKNNQYINYMRRSHAAQVTITSQITSKESMDMRWEQLKIHLAQPMSSKPFDIPPGLAEEQAIFSTIPADMAERKEYFRDAIDDEDEETRARSVEFKKRRKLIEDWQNKVHDATEARRDAISDRLRSALSERRQERQACQQMLKQADAVGPIKGKISVVMTTILQSNIEVPFFLYAITQADLPQCDLPPMPPVPGDLAVEGLSEEERRSTYETMYNRPTSLAEDLVREDDRINRKRSKALLSATAAGFSSAVDYFVHYHSTTITVEEKDRMRKATQLELDWLKQHPATQSDANGILEREVDPHFYNLFPPAPDEDDFLLNPPAKENDGDVIMT